MGAYSAKKHLQTELRVKLQNFCRLRARCVVAAEFNVGSGEAKVVPRNTRMKSHVPFESAKRVPIPPQGQVVKTFFS